MAKNIAPTSEQEAPQTVHVEARIPAEELLSKLLSDNGLELTAPPLDKCITFISDGGIIINKPVVGARYKK